MQEIKNENAQKNTKKKLTKGQIVKYVFVALCVAMFVYNCFSGYYANLF